MNAEDRVDVRIYRYREPHYEEAFEATSLAAALARAQKLLNEGDYEPSETESYMAEAILIEPNGEKHDLERVIDAAPPACAHESGEHDWDENPQAYGYHGGVQHFATCRHCGLVRRKLTWNPITNQREFRTVYERPDPVEAEELLHDRY